MKSKIFAILILFVSGTAFASDRFGNERNEVPRSSFTNSNDPGVVIATSPASGPTGNGGLILRSVYCSGVDITTITFYNAQHFNVNSSTRDVFIYGGASPTQVLGSYPSQFFFDSFYSSGIAYIKVGPSPCGIKWDYTTVPRHGDRRD